MKKIVLGRIVNTIGLKGELKILLAFHGDEMQLKRIQTVSIQNQNYTVEKLSLRSGVGVLKLKGFDHINAVEQWRDQEVTFSQIKELNLKTNEWISADLIGCKIVSQKGAFLGEITAVDNFGATDILFVKNGKEEYSVPFLNEIFAQIEIEQKTLTATERFLEVKVDEN